MRFAIVLLAPGDTTGTPPQSRVGQNVILEWGYFRGKLSRRHVVAL
jgi:predicted nucleotide-binding protein